MQKTYCSIVGICTVLLLSFSHTTVIAVEVDTLLEKVNQLKVQGEVAEAIASWNIGLQKLRGTHLTLSYDALSTLDRLVSDDDSNDLSSRQIFSDLLQLDFDATSKQILQERLQARNILKCIKKTRMDLKKPEKVPESLQDMMLQAHIFRTQGQFEKAANIYAKIIDEYANGYKDVVANARISLLTSLMQQAAPGYKAVQTYIDSFAEKDGSLQSDIWNFACRLLLHKVATAGLDDRLDIWRKGISKYWSKEVAISNETYMELDKFGQNMKNDNPKLLGHILTDLLLFSPDIASMRRLQWRRIANFVEQKDWDNALSAAVLDVMLSTVTNDGPTASVDKCLEIMQAADQSTVVQEDFRKLMWWGNLSGISNQKISCVDELLARRSQELNTNIPWKLSPRQRAYINLYDGKISSARTDICISLSQAKTSGEHIFEIFDDISLFLAISEGCFHDSPRFSIWCLQDQSHTDENKENPNVTGDDLFDQLIRYELQGRSHANSKAKALGDSVKARTYDKGLADVRKNLAAVAYNKWKLKVEKWTVQALYANDKNWAQAFGTLMLKHEEGPSQIKASIEFMYNQILQYLANQDAIDIFKTIESKIRNNVAQRNILLKVAILYYEDGMFAECVETIDSADKYITNPKEKADISIGIIRAMSYVRLRQFSDALSVLKQMENWPGTSEQHARVLFLIGWIQLQNSNKPKALFAFRVVVDKFPQTLYAKTAGQLIRRMEGF